VSKLTATVARAGDAQNGAALMRVAFMRGGEPLHSLTVLVEDPVKYGSNVALYAAAAMKAQEGSYNLSEEMHTALGEAIGIWISLRRLEVKGEG